ncbi:hypothetical protein GCM10009820_16950 [Leifsonia soli]
MSTPGWIERLLAADPRDVGCDSAVAALHVYVDMQANGAGPEEEYPGIAAHIDACDACAQVFAGLSAAVSDPDIAASEPCGSACDK